MRFLLGWEQRLEEVDQGLQDIAGAKGLSERRDKSLDAATSVP